MEPTLRDEKIHSLETTIRFYAAQSRRWETRCRAIELELEAARERLAVLGVRNYSCLDD